MEFIIMMLKLAVQKTRKVVTLCKIVVKLLVHLRDRKLLNLLCFQSIIQ